MADRFAAALDCADIGFLPDGVLDELPLPAQTGAGRIAGIDLNKPRIRAALSAALALARLPPGSPSPNSPPRSGTLTRHHGPVPARRHRDSLSRIDNILSIEETQAGWCRRSRRAGLNAHSRCGTSVGC